MGLLVIALSAVACEPEVDKRGRLVLQVTSDMKLPADVVWADGLYVWQLQNNAGRRTGKWVISR